MRIGAVLGSVLVVSGCVSTSSPPATEQEKIEAHKAHNVCLHRAAQTLDDGKSDAVTIAQAVINACATEWSYSVELYTKDMSRGAARLFVENIEKRNIGYAVTAVLRERAVRR